MRVYIRHKDKNDWNDITEYIHMPTLLFNETVDGSFSSLHFTIRTPKTIFDIDMTNPIAPKRYYVKLVENNNEWQFITVDNVGARVRQEVIDEEDNEVVSALYVQQINCENIIKKLENRFLPNYTVRQPKSKFYNTYAKGFGAEFKVSKGFSQDSSPVVLSQGIKRELAKVNVDDEIVFGYDSIENKHYIEFKEIDQVGLTVNFEMNLAKTSPGYYLTSILNNKVKIYVDNSFQYPYKRDEISKLSIISDINYYKNGSLLTTNKEQNVINYNAGLIPFNHSLLGQNYIKGFGNFNSEEFVLTINKHNEADTVRVYFNVEAPKEQSIIVYSGERIPTETRIDNFNNDSYIKTFIDTIVIQAKTTSYEEEIETKPTMLIDFVEKAIFDYNLNTFEKVGLASEVIPLLSVPMREGEYDDYTLRGLLERTFKYVGLIPTFDVSGVISYNKTNKVARYIDIEVADGLEKEHKGEDFYDKIVSNTKNMVSEENYTREILPLTSTNIEFSHMNEDNAGFVTTNDIYYVVSAILHTPDLEIEIDGESIKSNIDKDYYWDITERLFEEDIYNSFPNIKLDSDVGASELSQRTYLNVLTKANTIFYKSGSNVIGGLFNEGEYVPNYTFWSSFSFLVSPTPLPEYALTELLTVLAYTQASNIFGNELTKVDLHFKDIAKYTLDLTYVPIFNEITTKYTSNTVEKKGLGWESKFNIRDKVVSYESNAEVLRNEMKGKGNVEIVFSDKYESISDALPVNSIINDNLYITSRKVKPYSNRVEVDYSLQKDFLLQNEDIGLPIEFERYYVPYDYLERELLIENGVVFMKEYNSKYANLNMPSATQSFLEKVFLEDEDLDGTIYAKVEIDGNLYLMRVARIDTKFTMIFKGDFLDNYTAGVQRYETDVDNVLRFYTMPLRYADGNGKFDVLSNLEIGYNDNVDDIRLEREDNEPYDIKLFPSGEYNDKKAVFNVKLVDLQEPLMLLKDAREKVSINYTSFLQNETNDIKFYNFKSITKLGVLLEDISLVDDLTLDNIKYSDFDENYTISIINLENNAYKMVINSSSINSFENGIVLINEKNNRDTLVGVVKEPIIDGNDLEFYVALSRAGIMERGDLEKTNTPIIEGVFCNSDGIENFLNVIITNNDGEAVIRDGNTVIGTIGAFETKTLSVVGISSLPYNYNLNLTSQAKGKAKSDNVISSSTIVFCVLK